jgi:serine/threonine-protein kinase MRCK
VGDQKKIHQVEYLQDEQLMIALAGKQRQMRLVPVKALDQPETEWIKVADTKGCVVFATGVMRVAPPAASSGMAAALSAVGAVGGGGAYCLCVAVKRQVIIYEITRMKSRHKRLREVLLPAQAQTLDVFSDGRLCVGYQSGFTIYSLLGDQHPLCKLLLLCIWVAKLCQIQSAFVCHLFMNNVVEMHDLFLSP